METEHLIQVLDKWPDFVELYQKGDDVGTRRMQVVVLRRNSRGLQHEQLTLLQVLEDAGIDVRVRVGTVDLTIEQFEKGGVYKARPSESIEGTQAHYNARSALKKMEALLETIDENDPRYLNVAKRVRHFREMLNTVESKASPDAVKKSDQKLRQLEDLVAQYDRNSQETTLTDEKLLALDWPTLARMEQSVREPLWRRKVELHKQKEMEDVTSKPTTTSEVHVNDVTNEEIPRVVDVPPSSESD